ncbi:MAG: hypothetical protein M1824_003516 [Vezdaea acicularis]|nr:MAG: hypothetical protein M1824_003516 [Vezdaea acicularis]
MPKGSNFTISRSDFSSSFDSWKYGRPSDKATRTYTMRVSTSLWATTFALAVACYADVTPEIEVPRYYYPRGIIKRQIVSNTTTSAPDPPPPTTTDPPTTSLPSVSGLESLLSSLLSTTNPIPDPIPSTTSSDSAQNVPTTSSTPPDTASAASPDTTSTSQPVIIPLVPTTAPTTTAPDATTSSAPAVLFGPSGLITDPASAVSSVVSSAVTPEAPPSQSAAPTGSATASTTTPVIDLGSLGVGTATPTAADPSATTSSVSPILPVAGSVVSELSSALQPIASLASSIVPSTPPSDIPSVLSSALPDAASVVSGVAASLSLEPSASSSLSNAISDLTSSLATATDPAVVGSLLSSLLSSASVPVLTPTDTGIPTSLPVTEGISLPGFTGTDTAATPSIPITASIPDASATASLPASNPGTIASDVGSPPNTTDVLLGSIPATNSNPSPTGTDSLSLTGVAPTVPVSNTASTTLTGTDTNPTPLLETPAGLDKNVTQSSAGLADGSISGTVTLSVSTEPTTSSDNAQGPVVNTIAPTGTDSATTLSLPSQIQTQTGGDSSATQSSAPSGIPSSLPRAITPAGGEPQAAPNTTQIQVGFFYALNYNFVVSNSISQAQIFRYLPEGLAYGLGIDVAEVEMRYLQPYDTTKQLQYITTLAIAYIPDDMVQKLSLDLLSPASPLYNNPDPSIKTLTSLINPSLPVLAGTPLGSGGSGTVPYVPSSSATDANGPFGSDSGGNGTVRGTSIGIGVGVVAGAALYGAAMFLVARRYKKRRQRHVRSNSSADRNIDTPATGALMGGGPLMSGARSETPGQMTYSSSGGRDSRGSGRSAGNSARTQQISAPFMAENSLGWN